MSLLGVGARRAPALRHILHELLWRRLKAEENLNRYHLGPVLDRFLGRYEFSHQHGGFFLAKADLVPGWRRHQQVFIFQIGPRGRRAKRGEDDHALQYRCLAFRHGLDSRTRSAHCGRPWNAGTFARQPIGFRKTLLKFPTILPVPMPRLLYERGDEGIARTGRCRRSRSTGMLAVGADRPSQSNDRVLVSARTFTIPSA